MLSNTNCVACVSNLSIKRGEDHQKGSTNLFPASLYHVLVQYTAERNSGREIQENNMTRKDDTDAVYRLLSSREVDIEPFHSLPVAAPLLRGSGVRPYQRDQKSLPLFFSG